MEPEVSIIVRNLLRHRTQWEAHGQSLEPSLVLMLLLIALAKASFT